MVTDIYLQNRLIQTSQTGGQRYSDTSPTKASFRRLLHQTMAERPAMEKHSSLLGPCISHDDNKVL